MSTTRCKIPIGSFYGHIVILPGECYSETSEAQGLSDSNIQVRSVDLVMNLLFVYHYVRGTADMTSIAVVVVQFIGGVQLGRWCSSPLN
jgi:hypothetical protein